jgi:tetratricopeptide (TPR) repeat protein
MSTTTTNASEQTVISEQLLTALKRDIDLRRIGDGMKRLAGSAHIFASFSPALANAARFLSAAAEWCDVGFGDPEIVKRMVATYDSEPLNNLPISDYVHIRLAKGMLAMKEEMPGVASAHFDIALDLGREINAIDALITANYWKGWCLRRLGQYEAALAHVRKAQELQLAHGHFQELPALVLESLILFEKADARQSVIKLREAAAILAESDDYVMLGYIQFTYGRIREREQRYGRAIEHFEKAIELFQKRDPRNSNVARATVDLALARIQVARYLGRNIETCSDREALIRGSGPSRTVLVKELSNLYNIALGNLDDAAQIYQRRPKARGVAKMHLVRGYLYLDRGELDLSAQEAAHAYASAKARQDFIAMASARSLQCMVENALVEEQVDGWTGHALASHDYIQDAMELASNTQDRQLLATVYTWYGLTFSNSFFSDQVRARGMMDKAATYLEPWTRDRVWEDFQTLKRRVLGNNNVEPKLMQWAHGEIGSRTFRQLEDDFADLIIPVAWEQEKKKVSRVASRLSISPRKVRRILTRMGLLESEKTRVGGDVKSDEANARSNNLKDSVVASVEKPRRRPRHLSKRQIPKIA